MNLRHWIKRRQDRPTGSARASVIRVREMHDLLRSEPPLLDRKSRKARNG